MNLAEILVFTDIRQLHQIANHYGCECNPHSKNELITTLMTSLRHRQTMKQEVEQLTCTETHFLLLLFLDKRTMLSLEDLMAKAGVALDAGNERKQEEARRFIASAMKRGWVFPAKSKTVGQYQIPSDIREPYLQAWLDKWQRETSPFAQEPGAYRDEGTALCDDIMQFLQFLQQEPIPLTSDGGMYKRYQTQLFQFLHVKEEPLPPQKWRFGYGLHFDLYPDRFSLLYDFCYYQKWIEEASGRVAITEGGTEQLLRQYEEKIYHDLIRFWLRLYKRAIPNLPMLVQLIPLMTAGNWVDQETLCRSLLPWMKPFYYDDPGNILKNRVLKMMVHLGLLKVGQSDSMEWMYAGTYASQTWLRKYNGFTETTILLK
ncbi:hypothetical protein [Brevibacillus sp. H7]|uniref:hypothetical protein n=1 Tax=Brevibacillus sp. H7 TaxID=3349138 RepID=UPI0037F7F796